MTTIARFQAENYKRLKAVEITPEQGANLVPILGKNGQGKSSVLDAIMAALGGKSYMPKQPVRKGEDEGAIRLELSNGLVVRRVFAEDGSGTIVVENAEGARYPSPQAVLDKLYSSVAFDPIAFTRLKPAEQLETLRRLVKLEVDVDKLAAANKADYETRRDLNREAKQWEGQLSGFGDVGEPAEPIDTSEIEAGINTASEKNGEIERRKSARETAQIRIHLLDDKIREMQQQIDAAKLERDELNQRLALADPLPEPVDVSALTAKLSEAQTHNRRVERAKEKAALVARVEKLKADAEALTKAMEERETARTKAFQTAKMPVPGLAFGDGEVLFNDLPLEQASTAEQLRISVAIGMATNPELKVMLVRDASLLDEDSYALLANMAVEGKAQFWVESVDTSDKVGIVMEDGAVKDAPEPEPIDKGKRRAKKADEPEQQDTQAASGTAREAPSGSSSGEPTSDTVGAAPKGEGEAAAESSPTSAKPDALDKLLDANKEPAADPLPKPRPQPAESLFD